MQNTLNSELPSVVIDTQVVMDWLVFKNPSCDALSRAVVQRRLIWHTTPKMHAELMHVLGRGVAANWLPDLPMIDGHFERHAHRLPAEPPSSRHLLHCRDADDQMFLDLAIAVKARWLFSRDRAVLALARRARDHGIQIISPLAWNKLELEDRLEAKSPLALK